MRGYHLDAGEALSPIILGELHSLASSLIVAPHPARVTFFPNGVRVELDPTTLPALQVLLDMLTAMDRWQLSRLSLPTIYSAGVRYAREPKGREWWQSALVCVREGSADCEDLGCWCAAEHQLKSRLVVAAPIAQRMKGGGTLYHIVCKHPDGQTEDPSEKLGM